MPNTADPRVETLRLLASIDVTLKAILLVLSEKRGTASSVPAVDLDGKHGDPEVKAADPRDWTGPTMRGRRFSACPPEYLDLLADRFDYFASKDDDPKKRRYNELDAARARGWAERIRNGEVGAVTDRRIEEAEPRW